MSRPTGSKAKGSTEPRRTVQIRVTESEHEAFACRAAEVGLTVSEWLRTLARTDAGLWTGTKDESAPAEARAPTDNRTATR